MTECLEIEPEKLIEEVKKRPGLWDPYHKEYRIRPKRAKLWNEILDDIIGDAELSKGGRRGLEIQIQKRWRCYRDTFIRYVTRPKKYKQPYTHQERLQFLMKCVEYNKSLKKANGDETATSDSDEEKRLKIGWKSKKIKLSRDTQLDNSDTYNGDEFDTPSNNVETFEEEPQVTTDNEPYGEESFVFANVDSQPPMRYEPDDPDKMFLLSLLPHLKTIPDRHRLNVKIGMMQVLRNPQYNS
ncbi:uncharacterized protein LOC121725895 [Aricia agestis]|uniref:uncharacterized protein LOC121725895 n=1 Tax=Aricia agestis TaxID=91739 RepID=UPI001C203166|nr:uncharacterized protein LOC121725895 [Aricia agestis]